MQLHELHDQLLSRTEDHAARDCCNSLNLRAHRAELFYVYNCGCGNIV